MNTTCSIVWFANVDLNGLIEIAKLVILAFFYRLKPQQNNMVILVRDIN